MANEISQTKRNNAEVLEDIQVRHNQKKKKMNADNNKELQSTREDYQDQRRHLVANQEAAINHIKNKHQDQVSDTQEKIQKQKERVNQKFTQAETKFQKELTTYQNEKSESLSEAKAKTKEQYRRIKSANDARIDNEIMHGNQKLGEVREKYKQEMRLTELDGSEKLTDTRNEIEGRLQRERNIGKYKNEKLRSEFQKEQSSLRVQGHAEIKKQEDVNVKNVKNQREDYQKSVERNRELWSDRLDKQDKAFHKRYMNDKERAVELLDKQQVKHESFYNKREDHMKDVLKAQKDVFESKVSKEKMLQSLDLTEVKNKADDPFYAPVDRGSTLRESSEAYFIETYIPPHEKDLVKVNVNKNKVTISGARSNVENLDLGEKKISTNSYQTFKEEVPLAEPIVHEAVKKERFGDYVRLTIPKLTAGKKIL